jgi:phosphoribosyl-ATP pyrophosphohydrolase/phosphoribosyl-AMP cyclohydrolase
MNKKLLKQVDWKKMNNLIPAIIQDSNGLRVLMLGYMNEESLKKTLEDERVWFYSRSKKRLWMKGETSGNFLTVKNIYLDCDRDTLLITVKPEGPVCHTGEKDCFGIGEKWFGLEAFASLFELIEKRKKLMPEGSYTTSLFKEGLNKICAKIGEESGEVIKAATKETKQRLVSESVDLMYHLFVLLVERDLSLKQLLKEIIRRG